MTDENGRFTIPVEDFEGIIPTNIQTRKLNSDRKQLCSVLLFRNFSPKLRKYSFYEIHPDWKDINELRKTTKHKDSVYMDSIRKTNPYFLAEVTIKARYPQKRTLLFEQSIDAYYDVQAMIDQMRDEGKEIFTLYDFLNKVNPEIRLQEGKQIIYRGKSLPLAVDGKIMRNHQRFLIEEDIDAIKTLVISSGSGAKDEIGKLDFEEALTPIKEDFEELEEEMEITKASEKKATDKQYGKSLTEEPTAIAYIVSADGWNANRDFRSARGIRTTRIQGYTRPLEFYSPAYTDGALPKNNDHRRTLYWNPNVQTDKNGCVVIECYNADKTTPITISIETIYDGKPGSILKHSIEQSTH